MKNKTTWILVADGARGRFFKNDGPGKGLVRAFAQNFEGDHSSNQEIKSDRQGRTFDSFGKSRHSMEMHSDPHRLLKIAFLKNLTEILDKHCLKGDFDRLILVAPPKAMGDLRAHLSPHVAAKVSDELIKDLTHVEDNDLPSFFKDLLIL